MNIFIGTLGVLLIIGSIILGFTKKKNPGRFFPSWIPAVAGIVIFIFSCSFTIIPTGYTGVRSVFGQINETPANNGFCWKIPFAESIEQVCNKQQDITFSDEIWGETVERTAISYSGITVTYTISSDKSAWIYAHVSNYEDNLVTQSLVASAIKTVSKNQTDVDATNRGKIEPIALSEIQKSLDNKYGQNVVIVNKVIINNADFEQSYQDAIASKQQAQLAYEQQQIENQKNVEQAQAEADAAVKKAEGEASAIKIKAEAEAEANKTLSDSLSELILRDKMLDEWDGVLPLYVGGDNAVFDLGNLNH